MEEKKLTPEDFEEIEADSVTLVPEEPEPEAKPKQKQKKEPEEPELLDRFTGEKFNPYLSQKEKITTIVKSVIWLVLAVIALVFLTKNMIGMF